MQSSRAPLFVLKAEWESNFEKKAIYTNYLTFST